jgi:hypothetical protein
LETNMADDGSGQDPLANMQNLLGYSGLADPNTYLTFQGKLPFGNDVAGGGQGFGQYYTGFNGSMPPTNAQGQPIHSFVSANHAANRQYQQQQSDYQKALAAYNAGGGGSSPIPGQTLNNTGAGGTASGLPQAQQSALGQWGPALSELTANYQASPTGQAMANNPNAALIDYIQGQNQNMQAYPQGGSNGFGSGNSGPLSSAQRDMMTNNALQIQQLQAQGSAPAAASNAPTAPSQQNMRQAYLDALSNPGPLQQYGAGPPQTGQTRTGSVQTPSVMSAYLNANQGQSTPLLNTLRGLGGATA